MYSVCFYFNMTKMISLFLYILFCFENFLKNLSPSRGQENISFVSQETFKGLINTVPVMGCPPAFALICSVCVSMTVSWFPVLVLSLHPWLCLSSHSHTPDEPRHPLASFSKLSWTSISLAPL
jgi:hypothetical protein